MLIINLLTSREGGQVELGGGEFNYSWACPDTLSHFYFVCFSLPLCLSFYCISPPLSLLLSLSLSLCQSTSTSLFLLLLYNPFCNSFFFFIIVLAFLPLSFLVQHSSGYQSACVYICVCFILLPLFFILTFQMLRPLCHLK